MISTKRYDRHCSGAPNFSVLSVFCVVVALVSVGCGKRDKPRTPQAGAIVPNAEQAPNVAFRTINGDTTNLATLYAERPLVLSVYLGTDCPMCLMNLRQLSQRAERIKSYGWRIAALSADTPEENQAALRRNALDSGFRQPGGDFEIPLYSDINRNAMEALGCYRRALDTERHGIFLIDRAGVIRFSAVSRRPFEEYEKLMDTIKAINAAMPVGG